MGVDGRLLKGLARYVVMGGDQRDEGASLMGADGAISSGSSRKWSCSCRTGGLKP